MEVEVGGVSTMGLQVRHLVVASHGTNPILIGLDKQGLNDLERGGIKSLLAMRRRRVKVRCSP